jgi:ketosteroid isomerase-like protein
MNVYTRIALVLLGATMFSASNAQDTRDDEADVLLTIEREWEAALKGDQDKVDKMLTNDFMGWGKDSPAPRSKTSTSNWSRFAQQMGRVVRYEVYPLAITISGDVAVAHYLYSTAYKPKNGDIEMSNGRYTDVLIRTEDGWKFIAWHGGDDE